jgi:phosphate transport system permease protein
MALPPVGRFSPVFDALFRRLCQAAALVVIAVMVLLTVVLVWRASLAMQTLGLRFFTSTTWDPEESQEHRKFGALAFVWGTLTTSAIAMLIAVPLGVGTAAFLSEVAPRWVRRTGAFFVEMLAVVPSVVYGFWGLYVLAPVMQRLFTALGGPNHGGVGILSAGIILAVMIVPYVSSVSYDVIRAVPRSQREGALALGATRWQTIWSVVLPYARPGIVGGSFLALGRALGETMAVTMLIGNKTVIDLSPFATGNSIASVIANEFLEASYDLYLSALILLGLVLMLLTAVINSLARVLIWRVSRTATRRRPAAPAGADAEAPVPGAPRPAVPVSEGVTTAAPAPAAPARFRLTAGKPSARRTDSLMTTVLGLCLAVTTGSLFLILGYLVVQGLHSVDWNFFTALPRPVGELGGGMANAIGGSVLLVGLAALFAVPLGLGAAIYLAEYRSDRLGPTVRFVGELLAGVPSIVIGIFAYSVVVVPTRQFGWAGAFALAVMMIPVVMRAAEEALRLVPSSLRQASYALAASQHQTVLRVVVPAALPAVITAVFLSIARVAGETAPLLLTAGNNSYWPTSMGDHVPSLPVYIFNYAISPYDDLHRQAWAGALVLVAVVMLLNFGVRLATGKRIHQIGRAD